MNAKSIAKKFIFFIILLVASTLAKHLILGGVYLTKLQDAPALAASISPSIANPNSKNLPIDGQDFKILSTNYFDNRQWVVVSITSIPNKNLATLVLKNINGVYTVVLGPGTAFPASVAQSMPSDVASYLTDQGLLP